MCKIYFGKNSIRLMRLLQGGEPCPIAEPTEQEIQSAIVRCYGQSDVKLAFFSENYPDLLGKFFKNFQLIEAAGGLVRHKRSGKHLFILRGDKWDLPKGWLEKGETETQGALREVEEECGLKDLQILRKIRTTYHAYHFEGRPAIKKTHWYAMESDQEKTVPQQEEGITRAEWLAREDILFRVFPSTFPNIIDLVREEVGL